MPVLEVDVWCSRFILTPAILGFALVLVSTFAYICAFAAEEIPRCAGLWGTRFAVWAPGAHSVSLVGDFNFWDKRAHPMCCREKFGVWELFLPMWDLRGQGLPGRRPQGISTGPPYRPEIPWASSGQKYAYNIVTGALEEVIKARQRRHEQRNC